MSDLKQPQQITLTAEAAEALKARIAASPLPESDIHLMLGLISFNLWLQKQLSMTKLSIHRLKRLFGFSTEKKARDKLIPARISRHDDSFALSCRWSCCPGSHACEAIG